MREPQCGAPPVGVSRCGDSSPLNMMISSTPLQRLVPEPCRENWALTLQLLDEVC